MTDNFDSKVLGGSAKRGIVNPDLEEERKKCDFDQEEMRNYLFGSELVAMIESVHDWVEKNP